MIPITEDEAEVRAARERFTQGPWRVNENGARIDCDAGYVALAYPFRGEDAQRANAHLIAAAPELYDALFFAFNYIAITKFEPDDGAPPVLGDATYDKVIAQSGAALRKARGETP